jgi:Tol biopolymer transport system component
MKRVMILAGIACAAGCGPRASSNSSLPPVTVISSDSANQQSARVAPDGSRYFWWQPSGAGLQLWTAASDLKSPVEVPVTSVDAGGMPILWSPDRSKIAVISSDSGLAEVAVIPASGGAAQRVTHSVGFAIPQGWNPDGDRIVYVGSAGGAGAGTLRSFVTSLSHGGTTPLIPGETHPNFGVWSPDGSRIGYLVVQGTQSTIWIADSAGRNPRQLTTDGFESIATDLPWSPDGKWLAYESRRTGTSDIWVVSADSGTQRQLTHDVRNDRTPVWSPDGKWIAFVSDRGKQTDVWVVPAAGGPEQRVTDDPAEEELVGWLPGSKLAFLTGVAQAGIWSMSLADSSEHRLTPDSVRTGPPELSPDGKQVALRIDHGGGISDLAVMPTTGGPMRLLVQGGANTTFVWSPDGAHIAFISDRGGTADIWIADVATGMLHQVENWPGIESNPVWSGDGSVLYFVSDHDTRLTDVWQTSPSGTAPVRVTKQGTLGNVITRRGRPELFGGVLDATGQFEVVQVHPDGSLTTVWNRTNAFAAALTPKGDSLIIAESGKGGGGYTFRMIPATAGGGGRMLLDHGQGFGNFSDDGNQVLITIRTGATADIGLLDRASGKIRRLTNTPTDERAPVMTPDGKTVLFQRVRPSRRIAIADLSKVLNSNK